jgi:hypothetical protein
MPITLPIVYKSDPKGLKQAERDLGGFKKAVGGIASGLTVGFVAAGAALAGVLAVSIRAAAEAQKVTAQTDAAIRSTGGAAERSSEQIDALSDQLARMSGIDDEVIQGGQNILLTFTKIQGVNFDRATSAVLDMSVALDRDMKSAAIQVGKALNDPILGVSSLGEAGVQFSEDQKKMIRSLVETGRAADAQAIILEELNTQFGGSAAAFGETYAGQLGKFETALGNVQEQIGAAFLPVLGELVAFMQDTLIPIIEEELLPIFEGFADWLAGDGKIAIEGFVTLLADNVENLDDWALGIGAITVAVKALNLAMMANPVGAVITGLAALVIAGFWIYDNFFSLAVNFQKVVGGLILGFAKFIEGAVNMAIDATNRFRSLIGQQALPNVDLTSRFQSFNNQVINAAARGVTGGWDAITNVPVAQQWNAGSTPMMADGGVVMPSMGGSLVTVAEAGQPEVIAPLSWMEDRLGGGTGTVINVTVNAGLGTDGRSVGRLIVDEIRAFERKSGRVWVRA